MSTERERSEFEARVRAAWEEADRYWDNREPGGENEANDPQHQLAPEFYKVYLDDRTAVIAVRALATAFQMWSNLEGGSGAIEQRLAEISSDQRGQVVVANSVLRSFKRDYGEDEGEQRFTRWFDAIPSLETRSRILLDRVRDWNWRGEVSKVRRACDQIIEWNASDYVVKKAQAYIYDLDNLNVGQAAPAFSRTDLAGNVVALSSLQGWVVLLDFWATWCAPCRDEFPHLRRLAETFAGKPFSLVSISLDDDVEKARRMIEKENLAWTHICDGGWDSELATLYHVTGIPQTFLVDQAGCIHARGLRREQIDRAVAELLGATPG